MKKIARTTLALAAALTVSACGSSRNTELFSQQQAGSRSGDASAPFEQANALWEGRADRAKAEQAVKLWEEAAALDSTRADIQLKLTYGYYFLANAHVRWDDENEGALKALYEKGVKAGRNAVWLTSPDFAARIKKGEKWEAAVKTVDATAVAGLYWYATNMGKWALLDGFTTILREKDHIAATMERLQTLEPGFFHGAPHRYFGVYRTKIPFPGGDPPASRKHFEAALALAPNYLDTKVLFAEAYAVKVQDEALYDKLLKEVLAAPDDVLPGLEPENANAKRVAKKMLDEKDEYF